jgi:hypothetical protein
MIADLIGRVAAELKQTHANPCFCSVTCEGIACLVLRANLREALLAVVEAWHAPGCGCYPGTDYSPAGRGPLTSSRCTRERAAARERLGHP